MELYAPQLFAFSLIGGKFHFGGRSDATKMVGNRRDRVAMTHPHLRVRSEAFEERVVVLDGLQVRPAVFATRCGFHFSTEVVCHILRTIANAQYRESAANLRKIDFEGLGIVDTEGGTGENHPNHRRIVVRKFVVGQNFAERIEFTHAAADELSGLRPEVENNDFLLHREERTK